jgi:acyl carrier protein
MISAADARSRAQENLQGFPTKIVEAYLRYAETCDAALLDEVVLGVLHFYLAKPPATSLATLPGSTRLVEDLGCDSLTLADLMFMAETLFGIVLADGDIARITTLDELREHFRAALRSSPELRA